MQEKVPLFQDEWKSCIFPSQTLHNYLLRYGIRCLAKPLYSFESNPPGIFDQIITRIRFFFIIHLFQFSNTITSSILQHPGAWWNIHSYKRASTCFAPCYVHLRAIEFYTWLLKMPHLSSDLFNQMSLYDPTFYFSGEDKISYPEIVPDELLYGSGLSHLGKEGFDLESGALDYHFNGDELSHNQDEHTTSENDYFNYFWGENWLFTLKDSSDWSHVGEMEKPETPQPDDEVQAIWKSHSYNHENVEMSDNLNYEFPHGDGSKNMSLWKNCYECFDDGPSGNDELYGFIADESLSEWLGGFSPGYEEAVVATDLGSQEP